MLVLVEVDVTLVRCLVFVNDAKINVMRSHIYLYIKSDERSGQQFFLLRQTDKVEGAHFYLSKISFPCF